MNSFPSDELRRRFTIWSLAIFGSLSGSGTVQLESSAWGTEDPPTEAKSQSDKKRGFDRAAFQELLQAKELDAAAAMFDAAVAEGTEPGLYVQYQLASALLSAKHASGFARMEKVAKQTEAELSSSAANQTRVLFALSHQALATRLSSENKSDQAIDMLKDALAKLEAQQAGAQGSALIVSLVAIMTRHERAEEARELMQGRLVKALAAAQENANADTRTALEVAFSQLTSTLGSRFPAEVDKAYGIIEPMLRAAVESDEGGVVDYRAYQSMQTSLAMHRANSDAAGAMKLLESTRELGNKLADRLDGDDQTRLESVVLSLSEAESRVKAKLLHQTLVGQPAPEFDIEAVVNMPKVSWADLKGKVVLIDFWAVWCGPCIATFPHLQTWHKEYGDKGLVIVGVTRQYGYRWDAASQKQVADKEASLDVELAMLEEFRKAHELEHGFVVTPKGSDYNKKFGVNGIPQAVLVDQNGVIQMIRVGSQEKNAEELEAKIKSLLGV